MNLEQFDGVKAVYSHVDYDVIDCPDHAGVWYADLHFPGVYVWHTDTHIIYVGQSVDVASRIRQHTDRAWNHDYYAEFLLWVAYLGEPLHLSVMECSDRETMRRLEPVVIRTGTGTESQKDSCSCSIPRRWTATGVRRKGSEPVQRG